MLISLLLKLRALRRRDLPATLAIERACFAPPWREADFDVTLAPRGAVGLAAEIDGELCGYLVANRAGNRLRIRRLCVDPPARRLGVAAHFVKQTAKELRGGERLDAFIHERNMTAQLFLRSQGFQAINIDGDCYRFEYRPGEQAAPFMPLNRVAKYL
jgi:ribosomal protein S18 acetylase RimI-like enzyme